MNYDKKAYNLLGVLTAVFMFAVLLGVTVSTPYLYASSEQENSRPADEIEDSGNDDDDDVPMSTTDDRSELAPNNISQEYIQHLEYIAKLAGAGEMQPCYHFEPEYISYYGELLVPPPDRLG